MQRTFLSSVAAKTNRGVPEAKQQRSQKQASLFLFPQFFFHHISLPFLGADSFQVQKRRWPVFPHPESWVPLKRFPVNLSSHRAQTRPQLDSQFPAGNHFCQQYSVIAQKANYFKCQQTLVFLRAICLLTSLFSKLAYLAPFVFKQYPFLFQDSMQDNTFRLVVMFPQVPLGSNNFLRLFWFIYF